MALNSAINTASLGTGFIYSNGLGGLSANAGVLITKFTASGTWTKNSKTQYITVIIWNSGSGGGSGRQGLTTAAGGGAGGSSGSNMVWTDLASSFNTTETVTISGTAAGGLTQASPTNDGNNGTLGSNSSLGNISCGNVASSFGTKGVVTLTTFPQANSSWLILTNGATGSTAVTTVRGSNAAPGNATAYTWTSSNTGTNIKYVCTDGGPASGADSVTVRQAGTGSAIAQPGLSTLIASSGGTGGIETGTINGGNGNNQITTTGGRYIGATGGGGGGGQSVGVVAGIGGNGGLPCAGGGGGGGSLNGTTSGVGGDGARGELWVIEYFG